MPSLESLAVDVVGQGLHVGEAAVGENGPRFVALLAGEFRVGRAGLHHPAVVDADKFVADVGHAAGDHRVGRLAHQFVGDTVVVRVPVVPAHRRGEREAIAHHDGECFRGRAATAARA